MFSMRLNYSFKPIFHGVSLPFLTINRIPISVNLHLPPPILHRLQRWRNATRKAKRRNRNSQFTSVGEVEDEAPTSLESLTSPLAGGNDFWYRNLNDGDEKEEDGEWVKDTDSGVDLQYRETLPSSSSAITTTTVIFDGKSKRRRRPATEIDKPEKTSTGNRRWRRPATNASGFLDARKIVESFGFQWWNRSDFLDAGKSRLW
ncbi:hypothetical protein LXL04_036579 [Taraxacum kok-saghyz]